VPEDSGVVIYHRISGDEFDDDDNDLLTVAKVSAVTIKVFKLSDNSQVGTDITPSVSDVVLDTLVTLNSVAYNFKYKTLAASMPDGDEVYRFEILIDPVSGANFYLTPVEIPTIAMLSS
tara:strand:- start:79 stop:435 length:357 start_codon:yes stop_codon:yes gene_type:complete